MLLTNLKERLSCPQVRLTVILAILVLVLLFFVSCSGGDSPKLGPLPKVAGAADETSAIQSLGTIATAEGQLKAGRGSYGDFNALVQAGLLDERFSGNTPNLRGYRFTMKVTDSDFTVNADPQTTQSLPTTGTRHFYLDSADNAVRVNPEQQASKSDPLL
jgi:hypothetical protein